MDRFLIAGLGVAMVFGASATEPYLDPNLPIEKRVEDLLGRMTLEEKVSLCHGCTGMGIGNIERLGIGYLGMCDGPNGVRAGKPQTYFPTGIALASSWDPGLAQVYGAAIGRETKAAGNRVILGPAVNIMRTPLCGRNFEYFGEDPFLAGKIAAGYVRGVQSEHVAACAKHLVCNNQEFWRTTNSSEVDERTLREIYLPAFRMACQEGGAWMMMSAYNKINGVYASANRHIQYEIPKVEWGWDGAIVSDWGAVHGTNAILGGLDIEMPGSSHNFLGKPFLDLLRRGEVSESVLDDKVRRVLRLMFRTRLFQPLEGGETNTDRQRATARRAAWEGSVLLENDGILPLDLPKVGSIAVIGPNADKQHSMGGVRGSGGSSAVMPEYEITPLAGLREKLGGQVEILYEPGVVFSGIEEAVPQRCLSPGRIDPSIRYNSEAGNQVALDADAVPTSGLYAEYFDNGELAGEPACRCIDPVLDFNWEYDAPHPTIAGRPFSVRWKGFLMPEVSGEYELGLYEKGIFSLWLDGRKLVDQVGGKHTKTLLVPVKLEAGRKYEIRVEYQTATAKANAHLIWKTPGRDNIPAAVDAAKKADVAIVFAGTNHTYDKEALGWGDVPNADKPDLELIGRQAELIEAVAQANSNTIVVLINGSPVSVEGWRENVRAILECWYPGQEGGRAIADMLFGDRCPAGRLPCTFGKKLSDYACHANGSYPGSGNNGVVKYKEGIFVGYRWFDEKGIEPRYPFGHGLSYTTFKFSGLEILPGSGSNLYTVAVTVENTGKREGAEVVQVYVGDPVASVERPPRELKGFAKVYLKPGERKRVGIPLDRMAFSFYNTEKGAWTVEPGEFEVRVGSSSRNIWKSERFAIKEFGEKE